MNQEIVVPQVGEAHVQSAVDTAIATELAPAVAIELLAKSSQTDTAGDAALECLGAGVTEADDEGNVRVQLLFENGAVLPVEMSKEAGAALAKVLQTETEDATEKPDEGR